MSNEAGGRRWTPDEIIEPEAANAAANAIASPPPDVFPDFAISLEEAGRRVRMLQEFVRDHMTEGEDYGVIPGSTKPTLFKPGAEKLNAIFGLAPTVEVSNRHEDWAQGFVAYETKVRLINKRTGNIEAEGVGSCNSQERRYKNQDAPSIANTILKMSKKRALVDATLSATRASGTFTQDLEDLDLDLSSNRPPRATNAPSAAQSTASPENIPARPAIERPQTEQRTEAEPRFEKAQPRPDPRPNQASDGHEMPELTGTLTEAQYRAIMGIGNKVFGYGTVPLQDWNGVIDKPVESLSKGEASELIDRLRTLQAEKTHTDHAQTQRDGATMNRSSRY